MMRSQSQWYLSAKGTAACKAVEEIFREALSVFEPSFNLQGAVRFQQVQSIDELQRVVERVKSRYEQRQQ